ncbi:hypothetical protein V7266_12350 [Neobacillus drentensis]|uniref:hypothetical protein n=1 Tax=Neobacillus drentensis TaxID=220684 RepID=UPI002FFDED0A
MIKAIFKYLVSDEQLKNLISYTDKNRRINEFVPFNKEDYPYIVFEISPFLAGNPTTQYRCEINVLTKDVLLLESISNRLIDLLHKRKTGFISNEKSIYSSKHAGGSGIIYDPDIKVFQQTLIFNIKAQ